MIDWLNKNNKSIAYGILVASNIPFILILFYTHQISDDFLFAEKLNTYGFWEAQSWWYNNWIGRYSSTAFITTICYYEIYRPALILLFVFLYFSAYYFFRSFTNKNNKLSICLAISFISILLLLMPKTGEGLYWLTGAGTYLLSIILFLFFFSLLNKENRSKITLTRYLKRFFIFLLLFLIVGTNEVAMLFILVFLLVINFHYIIKNKTFNTFFSFLFFFGILCSYFVFNAPGTHLRMGDTPNNNDLLYSIYLALLFGLNTCAQWIFYSPLIPFSLLYFSLGLKFKTLKINIFNEVSPLWLFASLFILVIVCCFPSAWSQNSLPPGRTMNFIYTLFLILWWFFVQNSIQQIGLLNKLYSYIIKIKIHYWLTPLLILGSINLRITSSDLLSGRANNFQAQWRERMIEIEDCHQDTCFLTPLKDTPKSMFTDDLFEDENDWINKSTAILFNKKFIKVLEKDKEE